VKYEKSCEVVDDFVVVGFWIGFGFFMKQTQSKTQQQQLITQFP
jgi:hypothetical protein